MSTPLKTCPRCGQLAVPQCLTCVRCGHSYGAVHAPAAGSQPKDHTYPSDHPAPPPAVSGKPQRWTNTQYAALGALLLLTWVVLLSNEGARKEAAQGSNTYAKCAAQNGVKLLLTAPETAKFDTMQVTKNSDNAWAVTGYVTTKNLFGVPLRYRFGA